MQRIKEYDQTLVGSESGYSNKACLDSTKWMSSLPH